MTGGAEHCDGCQMISLEMTCNRFGGRRRCPMDVDAPRSVEGSALAARLGALLGHVQISGMAPPRLDMTACVAFAEDCGIDRRVGRPLVEAAAAAFAGAVKTISDSREAQS